MKAIISSLVGVAIIALAWALTFGIPGEQPNAAAASGPVGASATSGALGPGEDGGRRGGGATVVTIPDQSVLTVEFGLSDRAAPVVQVG